MLISDGKFQTRQIQIHVRGELLEAGDGRRLHLVFQSEAGLFKHNEEK